MSLRAHVLVALPFALSLACAGPEASQIPPAQHPWAVLEGKWLQVSEYEGKPAIIEPCAAGVREVTVDGEGLSVGWGQEWSRHRITGASEAAGTWTLQIENEGGPPEKVSAHRTAQGIEWTIWGKTIDTALESSEIPKMESCCQSDEENPIESPTGVVVPKGQPCP